MDPLDPATFSPTDDTLVQSQVVLFAAALFIGCTIFDVQSARIDLGKLFERGATPVTQQAARTPQPAAASFKASAPPATQQPFLQASLRTATPQRSAAACYRGSPQAAPASLHAWRKSPATAAPAASLIALVD